MKNSGESQKKPQISPVTLEVSTVGDELRIATGNRGKVWGLSLKDRAAVLMAGHLANGALWFDEDSGDWMSSKYYCTNGILPGWVSWLNTNAHTGGVRLVDSFTNRVWRFGFGSAADRIWSGRSDFSHSQTSTNYKDFTFTPYANDFVLHTARTLIEREQLGADDVPDILAINFSSNDYVGHQYGVDSAEVLDITVQTDRQLAAFFTWLEGKIGLNRVLVILTSDHGASPSPRQMKSDGHFDAAIAHDRVIEAELNSILKELYGFKEGRTNAVNLIEYNLYIHTDALRTDRPPSEIQDQVARFVLRSKSFGYYAAYTREQILKGQVPRTDICERIMKGFHPENSGDIVLVPKVFWVHIDPKYPYLTSHGSPYVYDTAVPLLLAGPGINHTRCLRPASTLDIAPTLFYLLGILTPAGSEGEILAEAVEER